jgi:hypothetical protein
VVHAGCTEGPLHNTQRNEGALQRTAIHVCRGPEGRGPSPESSLLATPDKTGRCRSSLWTTRDGLAGGLSASPQSL